MILLAISVPVVTTPGVFEQPEFEVDCLADGVLAHVFMRDRQFHGVMYVRGYSHDPKCRRTVSPGEASGGSVDFTVKFDTCGLFHFNGTANYVLGVQQHKNGGA